MTFSLFGCDDAATSPRARKLSGEQEQQALAPTSKSFSARLGTIANRTEIRANPANDAAVIGTLVAGDRVARQANPAGRDGCPEGWYAVAPRGFVCLDQRTTLDENHPTLRARAMPRKLNAVLPYPYARAKRDATLFAPDPKGRDGVRVQAKLSEGSVFAVVGSWNTLDEYDQQQRLAMLTSGQFIAVRDIEPYRLPHARGISLDGSGHRLPLALIEREATSTYRINSGEPKVTTPPISGPAVNLTGKFRLIGTERYWTTVGDTAIREKDVRIVRKRQDYPSFADNGRHWADIDSTLGTLVLYEGQKPTYVAAFLSLPREPRKATTRYVIGKWITDVRDVGKAEAYREQRDRAWVIELDDGMRLGSSQNDTEPSGETPPASQFELCPEDAHQLFQWVAPEVPEGWHAVATGDPSHEGSPISFH